MLLNYALDLCVYNIYTVFSKIKIDFFFQGLYIIY